jgi:hypothetical protein
MLVLILIWEVGGGGGGLDASEQGQPGQADCDSSNT